MGITFESIKKDLVSLGVKPGDTVFLRISYKAIGKLEGRNNNFNSLSDKLYKQVEIVPSERCSRC